MLTHRQRHVLQFVQQYQEDHGGVTPTFAEIAAAMGLRSKSGVVYTLDRLAERGVIRRLPNRQQAIEVIRPVEPHLEPKWNRFHVFRFDDETKELVALK